MTIFPAGRRRQIFLYLLTAGQTFGFITWGALLKNFAVETINVDGFENAVLETVREIPGFLAFTTVFLLAYMREQRLAVISTLILGGGIALTGMASSLSILLAATFVMSVGFHYYQTVYKSLSLQWFDGQTTAIVLGRVVAVSNAATLLALGLFMILFWQFEISYAVGYFIAGSVSILVAVFALVGFPNFSGITNQRQGFVLRWRYGLYYILTFLSGARRQIFIVFATFILVDIFALTIVQMLTLLLVNATLNMGVGLLLGPAINKFGERLILKIEYAGLFLVFLAYSAVLASSQASWALPVVIGLYIIDHILFQFAIAMETYFKKIAHPSDFAGSAAVSFSINHIAAVTLPPLLGMLYISTSIENRSDTLIFSVGGPTLVFWVGAGLAFASFVSACFIKRDLKPLALG